MTLDQLLKLLEEVFDAAMALLGPLVGFSPEQIAKADADLHALVTTIERLERRDIEAQTGAERIVRDLMELLNDLGVDPHFPADDTPTALDAALEALLGVLDGALDFYGPRYNLDPYTLKVIKADLAGLMSDIRTIEHGHTPLTDGLVRIVDDVFNMLRDFGVPVLDTESSVHLAEKSALLRRQLQTLMGVISAARNPPRALAASSVADIRKLESDLVALGENRDGVTLFEVVHDMTQVVRRFVRVLA
ncbi:uncharacterized protein LOC119094848 [Pollicipes pollicipes]|uniref:uncharacterized protein LOC119094848 n=1 Tax=Pollicipes pollicipes TaxID=41117 RepID=UPI001885381F|nr:uncharacterized protein LOC119094848 [Pollicipes pollicipes]